jgi:uncharacterized protein (TIGR02271 family)
MAMRTAGSTVVGVFRDPDDARDAINALKDAGFRADDIGLLTRDREEARAVAADTGTEAGEGAATGAVAGGLLGGLLGWLVGIGSLVIPGVGPFVAAGVLGAALTGAAIGAGLGAIAGALVGMGIPEDEAEYYEGEVRSGRTLVTVRADGRYDDARAIMQRAGAYDFETRDAVAPAYAESTGRWEDEAPRYRTDWERRYGTRGRWDEYEPAYRYTWEMRRDPRYRDRPWREVETELRRDWEVRHRDRPWDRFVESIRDAWERRTNDVRGREGERIVELREEELRATKRPVETGEVRVGKEVVTRQETLDVPVTREEVVVARHPVEPRPSNRPVGQEQTIEVPVREERVEVEKQPVVYEEVEVGKRQVQETEQVSGTVRREEVRVEREGDVDVRTGGTGAAGFRSWDEVGPTYQTDWERRYGTSGRRWRDVEPFRRYSYEMAHDPRYRGRDWSEVEPELRADYGDWSRRRGYRSDENAWDRFKDQVREAWLEARSAARR